LACDTLTQGESRCVLWLALLKMANLEEGKSDVNRKVKLVGRIPEPTIRDIVPRPTVRANGTSAGALLATYLWRARSLVHPFQFSASTGPRPSAPTRVQTRRS
jgi:hypothetical protein